MGYFATQAADSKQSRANVAAREALTDQFIADHAAMEADSRQYRALFRVTLAHEDSPAAHRADLSSGHAKHSKYWADSEAEQLRLAKVVADHHVKAHRAAEHAAAWCAHEADASTQEAASRARDANMARYFADCQMHKARIAWQLVDYQEQ